jgi:hypothetical protein
MTEIFSRPDYKGFCGGCKSFDGTGEMGNSPDGNTDVADTDLVEKTDKSAGKKVDTMKIAGIGIAVLFVYFFFIKKK